MVGIIDVAKMAKVSTATVSRVLSKNENVSSKTRDKVLEVVNQLEYKPNRLASNLRKMSSKTVMAVVPDITNPFFSSILQGFKDVALEYGYHVLLGDTGNSLEQERVYINLVKERVVDGLILATARLPKEEILAASQEIPVVLACEYIDGFDIPTVAIDNVSAAREAVEHLIHIGHRRIGLITGPLGVILSKDRVKGYYQALNLNEISIEGVLIQEGDFSVTSGYETMLKLLALDDPPTAVFATNDEMAVGAMKAIKQRGLKVPNDISVIGFDDIPLCKLVEPELTTISQPRYDMGYQAMQMLLTIIEKGNLTRKQIVLPHHLKVRKTCINYYPHSF
ncbi:LacI family DNA-binding transcriptional regulator [Bacillus sp. AFS031507]|uniref:LacI family DNA-binding transcriptional regulator n=1 Tax=Bacillus sp. AFS031507 TaxID=2033496 RepID=UPI000BFD3D93|nr:LacI family DNA-binding transcriptional regulator [Bacillus sp. AFS031507]PGY11937.1 LacI family transcriptional regulator [Bacillus sp. AFS031507]